MTMTDDSRAFMMVGLAIASGTMIYAANKWNPYATAVIFAVSLAACIVFITQNRRTASGKTGKGVDYAKLGRNDLYVKAAWVKENLRGHDQVVNDVVDTIQQELYLAQSGKVLSSFLLVGPTGTGKTFLAQLAAQALYPDSEPVVLRMNQLKHPDDVFTLIGAPPGRPGYEMGGSLTRPVLKNPYRVVIFDELDKCHPDLHDCLYDILDTAQCREKSSGKVVDFSGCVFFGTCNSGIEDIRAVLKQADSEDVRATKIRDALVAASSFQKPFLARWTRIEFMDELKPLNVAEVVLLELSRYWRGFGIELTYVDPRLVLEAVEKNEEFRAYGVRQLSAFIRRQTTQAITQARRANIAQAHLDVSPAGEIVVKFVGATAAR
jgi:ATP-dependent Clp protease ATP-binding subunit ClpC